MGFYSDPSSLPTSASNSASNSSSSGSCPTDGQGVDTLSLTATLTADNINALSALVAQQHSVIGQTPAHVWQSNSVLLTEHQRLLAHSAPVKAEFDRVDKSSPRLKQTNLPIMRSASEPFNELLGVEFGADLASEPLTQSDADTSERSEVGMRSGSTQAQFILNSFTLSVRPYRK